MTTGRQFCRFNSGPSTVLGVTDTSGLTTREIPRDGVCLSAFLVLVQSENENSVLMGRLNPKAHWDHIGALDEERVKLNSHLWMLPSSHLLIHESPQQAAIRIAKEQLELQDLRFEDPKIVSEVYPSRRFPEHQKHWDLEFIFKSKLVLKSLRQTNAWDELKFLDLAKTEKSEIGRSHEDILEYAGLRFSSR
jgi:ADP-ribose pyrophosphatase YjhB (NUDIX family)